MEDIFHRTKSHHRFHCRFQFKSSYPKQVISRPKLQWCYVQTWILHFSAQCSSTSNLSIQRAWPVSIKTTTTTKCTNALMPSKGNFGQHNKTQSITYIWILPNKSELKKCETVSVGYLFGNNWNPEPWGREMTWVKPINFYLL